MSLLFHPKNGAIDAGEIVPFILMKNGTQVLMFVCSCVKDAKSIKTREDEEGKRITQQKTIAVAKHGRDAPK